MIHFTRAIMQSKKVPLLAFGSILFATFAFCIPAAHATTLDIATFDAFVPDTSGYAGYSMAKGDLNNDGFDDLVIGAPLDDTAGADAGAVYLFYGEGTAGTTIDFTDYDAKLTGESAGDQAGFSVAIGEVLDSGSNDGKEIIIGAPYDDDSATDAGAVYVFSTDEVFIALGIVPVTVSGEKLLGLNTLDYAGFAVAAANVVGTDPLYEDVIIGIPYADGAGSNEGAVAIIEGNSVDMVSGSINTLYFDMIVGVENDEHFGSSVASGTVDGLANVLIGAPDNDDAEPGAGAVYFVNSFALELNEGTAFLVTDAYTFELTGISSGDSAGAAVAEGDLNGDGNDEIIVSAPEQNASGVVHVFSGAALPSLSVSLSTADAIFYYGDASARQLGTSIAVGNLNGDAYEDLIIGEPGTNDTTNVAYIMYGSATISTREFGTTAADIEVTSGVDDSLGFSTLLADVNADGLDDVLIGSPYASTNAGRVYAGVLFVDSDSDGVDGTAGLIDGTDCDDADAAIDANQTYYADSDGDSLGDAGTTTSVCSLSAPAGYVSNSSDTNDNDADNDGVETEADCDDTDATVDTNITYYADADGDGFGDAAAGAAFCALTAPAGYVANSTDTNDNDADNDGTETETDCEDTNSSNYAQYFLDTDSDGLGSPSASFCLGTSNSTGYVTNNTDTNDNDEDNDGTETEVDCDDTDATLDTNTTYYADTDSDGLGDPDTPTAFCSATAPAGYVTNNTDVAGETPADDDEDPTVVSVEGSSAGQIIITYSDGTSETVTVFDTPSATKLTLVSLVDGTDFALVLHPKGKKLSLVNALTGTILGTVKISKKVYSNRSLKQLDLRGDGSLEAVVTMKKGKTKAKGRVVVVKVNTSTESLTKKDAENFASKKVRVGKTKKKGNTLILRNKNSKPVLLFTVTKKYHLKAI